MHWLLMYDYVEDVVERRAPIREAHLALARRAEVDGTLLLAGALADPVDGAVFVFRADERCVVESFVASDPYVEHGLVTAWRVRPWTVVAGGDRLA